MCRPVKHRGAVNVTSSDKLQFMHTAQLASASSLASIRHTTKVHYANTAPERQTRQWTAGQAFAHSSTTRDNLQKHLCFVT